MGSKRHAAGREAEPLAPARWWEALGAGLAHAGLFAAAFPPFNLWLLALLALGPLVWLSGRVGPSGAARAGLLVGSAQLPLWAFEQRWLIDVTAAGYPLMVLGMSAFAGLFVWLLARVRRSERRRSWGVPAVPLAVAVPLLWVGLEFLRGHILVNGYPWYLIAHPLIEWPVLASPAAIGGTYLVSVLVGVVVGAVADAAHGRRLVGGVALLAALAVWGGSVLWRAGLAPPAGEPLRIALVQTNVPQDNKSEWTNEQRVRDFIEAIDLTLAGVEGDAPPDLVVWPETMYPGYFLEPSALEAVGAVAREHAEARDFDQFVRDLSDAIRRVQRDIGVPMLIGVRGFENLRVRVEEDGLLYWDADAIYNSAVVIEGGRVRPGRYDKLHLTPFGEVMPYVHRWPWLQDRLLALGAQGMQFELAAGGAARALEAGRARVATPICFEATMSAICRRLVFASDGTRRADVMVNLTNDGWFGHVDAGRAQHLQAARWRCVELATPMARAANTGISCGIDARGRLLGALPVRAPGVLTVELPGGVATTPYARVGDAVGWVALAGGTLLLLWTWRPGRKKRSGAGEAD